MVVFSQKMILGVKPTPTPQFMYRFEENGEAQTTIYQSDMVVVEET